MRILALSTGMPASVEFRPLALDAGPFGAFAQSQPLSDDGRIVAVATAGHTPGTHLGHLRRRRRAITSSWPATRRTPSSSYAPFGQTRSLPSRKVSIETMQTILAHARCAPDHLPAIARPGIGRPAHGQDDSLATAAGYSGAQRAIDRAGDLLARARPNRAAEGHAPALRAHRRLFQPKVRHHHGLVDVNGDLLGAAASRDVLSPRERGPPAISGETHQVTGDQRHGPPGAFLPGRIGRGVDDDLTDDSPPRVVRIASRDQKPRQGIRHGLGARLGPVPVQMPQCGTNVSACFDRPGQLSRGRERLAALGVDPPTVLGGRRGASARGSGAGPNRPMRS